MEPAEQEKIITLEPDIEPETLELVEKIRAGTLGPQDLQARLDRDSLIEKFLNVKGFERRLEKYLKAGVKGILVAVDVDDFKNFNDTEGHPAGDRLLKKAAEVLLKQTRIILPTTTARKQRHKQYEEMDLLGRVGGDEFLVFLVGAQMPDAIEAAKRIRHSINEEIKQDFPNYGPEQTMSLGLTAVRPSDTVLSFRERADAALYVAKEGKGSIPEDAITVD